MMAVAFGGSLGGGRSGARAASVAAVKREGARGGEVRGLWCPSWALPRAGSGRFSSTPILGQIRAQFEKLLAESRTEWKEAASALQLDKTFGQPSL